MEFRYAVDSATGQFLYGGAAPYDCEPGLSKTQIRVVTDREVDLYGERWDAQNKRVRPATSDEQGAVVTAKQADEQERIYQASDLGPIVKKLVEDVAALKAAGRKADDALAAPG